MKIFYCIAIVTALLSCNNNDGNKSGEQPTANIDGAGLFAMNCASCHKCDMDFTGPSLKGAASRWKDKELMYEFIRNPMAVVQKDSYAAELQKKYNAIMTPSTLTNAEIDAVLAYCNNSGGQ
ncbi:MAG: cytochrome c [Ferruginibacter sp.]